MSEQKPLREHQVVHLVLVLLVFTCTGFTVAWIGREIAAFTGLARTSVWYWLLWIFGLLPIYNVIILVYAFIFGKYRFFREKQKKTWKRIRKLFGKKDS